MAKSHTTPSLKDIRRTCEQIRNSWSAEERARRQKLGETRRAVLFGTLRIAQLESARVA